MMKKETTEENVPVATNTDRADSYDEPSVEEFVGEKSVWSEDISQEREQIHEYGRPETPAQQKGVGRK